MAGSEERGARRTPLSGDRERIENEEGKGEATLEWWSQSAKEEERVVRNRKRELSDHED